MTLGIAVMWRHWVAVGSIEPEMRKWHRPEVDLDLHLLYFRLPRPRVASATLKSQILRPSTRATWSHELGTNKQRLTVRQARIPWLFINSITISSSSCTMIVIILVGNGRSWITISHATTDTRRQTYVIQSNWRYHHHQQQQQHRQHQVHLWVHLWWQHLWRWNEVSTGVE